MVAAGQEQLSLGGIGLRLGAVLVLVLLNGFFVAAEFALVAARRSRIDQMAESGDGKAARVRYAQEHLDRYISGTQLGITLASLALGWIGEPALALLVDRGLAAVGVGTSGAAPGVVSAAAHSGAAIAVAFAIITFLHIVLGELAPKSLALAKPEGVSRQITLPLMWFSRAMSPFISVLNGAGNAVLKPFGIRPVSEGEHVHSPEELRLLVVQARAHGTLDESDSAMLTSVFDFHEKKAYDVMRPRTVVAAIDVESTEDEVWQVLRAEGYSRYPVYRETLDDIIGVLLAKDVWLRSGPGRPDDADTQPFAVSDLLREALYVPSTRAAELVLSDLRRTRAHLAIVLDEYGGTAGIVTLEDLVEEVVGEISDEYDPREREVLEYEGVLELAGSVSMVDVRGEFRLAVPEGDWTTLGGYVFSTLGRLPHVGDRAAYPGGELEVVAMDGRRVAAVRVHRHDAAGAEAVV